MCLFKVKRLIYTLILNTNLFHTINSSFRTSKFKKIDKKTNLIITTIIRKSYFIQINYITKKYLL